MWEGGITNPIEVISQLTYLMFIRSLDEKELQTETMEQVLGTELDHIFPKTYRNAYGAEIAGDQLRWSRFKDMPAQEMFRVVSEFVFPFIKQLGDGSAFSKAMESATFGFPAGKPSLLEKAVDGVEGLLSEFDDHIGDLGDLYEYMLSKLSTAGTNGQFRTPQHIRNMMVAMLDPKPGELICDPACGTAGFLISAAEHIRKHHESSMTGEEWDCYTGTNGAQAQFSGFEMDQTMLRISTMNLMLHGVDAPDVCYLDSISKNNTVSNKYDVVLANPPFTGSVDVEDIDKSLRAIVDSKQTELLFVALFLRMLKTGGRCACIVPNGVLFRSNSKAYEQLRRELVERQKLEAIIYMPSGVFKPYSGVSTAILVFTKTDAGDTDKVWLYNMEGDGFTLDDKRDEDAAHNDIPDILNRWANLGAEKDRARTDKSFLVPRSQIEDNGYDFSFNKYTETVYERIEYPPTEEILAELDDLNKQMAKASQSSAACSVVVRMTNKPQFVGEKRGKIRLNELCTKGKSSLRQKDISNGGPYAVYGASGIVGSMNSFQNAMPYVAVVKDGAGVGRTSACAANTSVLGTMQALIPTDGTNRDYLLHLIRSLRLGDDFSGSTIPHIYFKDYGKTLVPFHNPVEQQRIVDILSTVERQIEGSKQQLDQLDSLVKSRFVDLRDEGGELALFFHGRNKYVKRAVFLSVNVRLGNSSLGIGNKGRVIVRLCIPEDIVGQNSICVGSQSD